MKASLLYKELTEGELRAIVSAHLAPAALTQTRMLTGGMFNTTNRLPFPTVSAWC